MAEGAGLTAAAAGLGRALIRARDAKLTVYGNPVSDRLDSDLWVGATLVRSKGAGQWRGGIDLGLSRELTKGKYDVVHSHGLWLGHHWGALRAGQKNRMFRIVSAQGHLDAWALRRSALKKKIVWQLYQKESLRTAGCLHALHEGEVSAFRTAGLANPTCVIPNGIDPPPAVSCDPPWREKFAPGGKILLFLGRVAEQKGAADLVAAWAEVIRTPEVYKAGWRLVVAGWPQPATIELIQKLVEQHSLQTSVCVLGPQKGSDKGACFAQADAFVLPSRSEGLPMAVLEAWSYSLPVAMTDACNLPVGFARKAAFRIVNEPGRLAAGLSEFLAQPQDLRNAMGQEGKRLTQTEFAWTTVAARMMEVYEWGMGRGAPPSTLRFQDSETTSVADSRDR